ncbi:hypothetical protein BG015_000206 [Linnemannia schmuckeri]|uniref:F-box domain-containing protein n=1 Tax=Linnemannia schmuckeri TaxID=64567 RepID=A0A9P5RTV4_9FUNG|nr:hypothetical protein BG015_000206 [Linnemannia schmuckeri]
MKTASTRFFNITELLIEVASFLDRRGICRLLQTCHQAHIVLAPILFQTLDFLPTTPSYSSSRRLLTTATQLNALKRNIHHATKNLDPKDQPSKRIFFSTIPSVKDSRARLQQLCWIITQCPLLSSLELTLELRTKDDLQCFVGALAGIGVLQTLRLVIMDDATTWPTLFSTVVLHCPPTIEELCVLFEKPTTTTGATVAPLTISGIIPRATPQSLTRGQDPPPLLIRLRRIILHSAGHITLTEASNVFSRCLGLVELNLFDTPGQPGDATSIATILSKRCPNFRRLRSLRISYDEDQQLALAIMDNSAPQTFEAIELSNLDASSTKSLQTFIRRHSMTLREIRIQDCRIPDSATIQCILCNCAQLEVLCLVSRDTFQIEVILADAVAYKWASRKMKRLELSVAFNDLAETTIVDTYDNISYSSYNDDAIAPFYQKQGPVILTDAERALFKMLEQFYQRLGELTELEYLDLRAVPSASTHASFRKNQQAFPGMLFLGNGSLGRPGYLRLLEGWKKLKYLKGSVQIFTSETMVTVGQAEFAWMVDHWPSLRQAAFLPPSSGYWNRGKERSPEIRWLRAWKPTLILQ